MKKLLFILILLIPSVSWAQRVTSIQYPPDVTSSSFTIKWTTDVPASSWVKYGLTSDLDLGTETPHDLTLLTNHGVVVSGLSPNTTYHWQLNSITANGNWLSEPCCGIDYKITTPVSNPTSPPIITSVTPWAVGSQSALINWTTDQSSDSQIEYGFTSLYGQFTPLDTASRTEHSQSIYGLIPLTTYHYRVRSANAFGPTFSVDKSFLTPLLSGCHVEDNPLTILELASIYTGDFHDGDPNSGRVIITWLTREPADSQVEWGLTPFYGPPGITQIDFPPVTIHTRSIGPLVAGQLYYYRVRSRVANLQSGVPTVYCATGVAQTILPIPVGLQTLQDTVNNLQTTVNTLTTTPSSSVGGTSPTGTILMLAYGTPPPDGYTYVGKVLLPTQTNTSYVLLTIQIYRKN